VLRKACFKEEQFYFNPGSRVPNGVIQGTSKVQGSRNVAQIMYTNTGGTWRGWSRGNQFTGRWTTNWMVKTGGKYKFFISSDDGSRLYLDGKLIINNDGLHGLRRKDATRTVNAGRHALKIYMFEQGGHAGMFFAFMGADTENRWSYGQTYGGMTCPKRKAAGLKPPTGIVQNYDQRKLFRAGWKVWTDVPYRHHTVRKDIQPTKGQCVLWGSKKASGSTTLTLAAFGRRKKIENKKRVWENGVYWYTQTLKNGNGSNGFAANEKLALNSADIMNTDRPDLRLSWHLHTNFKVGGYRSGKKTGLNGDGNWRKVVMYGPCSGVKGGKR